MKKEQEKRIPNALAMYLPVSTAVPVATIVARGSAIVGPAASEDAAHLTVDYEGAVYGQVNLKTYADRARQAAGRHLSRSPTSARLVVARSDLRQIGWFDPTKGIMLFNEMREEVASWLGVEIIDPAELSFSD